MKRLLKNLGFAAFIGVAVVTFGAYSGSGGWGDQPEGTGGVTILDLAILFGGVAVIAFAILTIRDFMNSGPRAEKRWRKAAAHADRMREWEANRRPENRGTGFGGWDT